MTIEESTRVEEFDVENAFAHFEAQTGLSRSPASFRSAPMEAAQTNLPRDLAHFSVVPVGVGTAAGYNMRTDTPLGGYIVARPFRTVRGPRGLQVPDADRWWVFDSDVDETEGWVAQATFTPDGMIDYGGPDGDGDLGGGGDGGDGGINELIIRPGHGFTMEQVLAASRAMEARGDDDSPPADEDDDDDDLDFAPRGPSGPPRNPNAPVRMSIDLDDAETNRTEGLPAWEVHDDFAVLVNDKGFAVVHNSAGMVRYPDKTACTFSAGSGASARETAERFLATRPYKTAMQRVLEEPSFDTDDEPPAVPEAPAVPSVQRPAVAKRVWNTVPITSADEDD
jgi:hypothetical protein